MFGHDYFNNLLYLYIKEFHIKFEFNLLTRFSNVGKTKDKAPKSLVSGVVTVQDSQSGKSYSSILNLAKNVQKSRIKCLKEQNIHRKQSVYAYLIVNI